MITVTGAALRAAQDASIFTVHHKKEYPHDDISNDALKAGIDGLTTVVIDRLRTQDVGELPHAHFHLQESSFRQMPPAPAAAMPVSPGAAPSAADAAPAATTTAAADVATTAAPTSAPTAAALVAATAAMTVAAKAGDTVLEVENAQGAGFNFGDTISIGQEINRIVGFGSIKLGMPLQMDHPAGTVITKVSSAPPAAASPCAQGQTTLPPCKMPFGVTMPPSLATIPPPQPTPAPGSFGGVPLVMPNLNGDPVSGAAGGAVGYGAQQSHLDSFVRAVADVLTCQQLEDSVHQQCASVPAYEVLDPLNHSLDTCNAVYGNLQNLQRVFVEYLGPDANCETIIELWRIGGFSSFQECKDAVREQNFHTLCGYAIAQ